MFGNKQRDVRIADLQQRVDELEYRLSRHEKTFKKGNVPPSPLKVAKRPNPDREWGMEI